MDGGGGARVGNSMHKCPRCNSFNTKFCYYNNYSLSQPRYFCKACRRYWTQGGTLRNIPVGGGCRKTKRQRTTTEPTHPPLRPPIATSFNTCPSFLSSPIDIISPAPPHQFQPHYFPQQPHLMPAASWTRGTTNSGGLSSSFAASTSNLWSNNSAVNNQAGSSFTLNQWLESNTAPGFNPSQS